MSESDELPVPLDYHTPQPRSGTARLLKTSLAWTRTTLLWAATVATAAVVLTPLVDHFSDVVPTVVGLPVLLLCPLGALFWPICAGFALAERWRPSNVLGGFAGAYLLVLLGLSMATVSTLTSGDRENPIGTMAALTFIVAGPLLVVDLARARKLPAVIGVALLLFVAASFVGVARCPHATQLSIAGHRVVLRGEPCGNTQHFQPWWSMGLTE